MPPDHEHAFQFLAALVAIGGAGWVGYRFGKDQADTRCAVALLGLGEMGLMTAPPAPMTLDDLPIGGYPSSGCGCR